MANLDQFLELCVNERLAHQMKANLLGQRGDLLDDGSKQRRFHALFRTNHFGAKTALKVADIADFNIDLLEPHSGIYSIESIPQLGHSTQLPPFVAFGCPGFQLYWIWQVTSTVTALRMDVSSDFLPSTFTR